MIATTIRWKGMLKTVSGRDNGLVNHVGPFSSSKESCITVSLLMLSSHPAVPFLLSATEHLHHCPASLHVRSSQRSLRKCLSAVRGRASTASTDGHVFVVIVARTFTDSDDCDKFLSSSSTDGGQDGPQYEVHRKYSNQHITAWSLSCMQVVKHGGNGCSMTDRRLC